MNFKNWILLSESFELPFKTVAEVFQDLLTKDVDVEIIKNKNSFIHYFEKNGYQYKIELQHAFLPPKFKKALKLDKIKKEYISYYAIDLKGPFDHKPTNISGHKAFEIYEILLATIKKVITDPNNPPADILTFLAQNNKMSRIYDIFFRKFLPNYIKIDSTYYMNRELLNFPSPNLN